MMENLFSLKRFWLLARIHAKQIWKIFLISLVVMIIPDLYTQTILYAINPSPDRMFEMYIFFLVLLGGVFTGMFFKDWTYKSRAVSALMLPATTLEKFAVVLFYSLIVFVPVFTFVYCGSNYVLLTILHPEIPFSFIDQYRGLSPLPALLMYALLPYTFFQSLVLLFSIYFKQRQTVTAFSAIAFLFILIGIWNRYYIDWLLGSNAGRPDVSKQFVFFPTEVSYWGATTKVTSLMITDVSILIIAISTLLFYIASYLKLKEKEI